MDGFQSSESSVVVTSGAAASLTVDLRIAAIQERVDVTAQSPVSATGSLAATTTVTNAETQLLAAGEGFQSAIADLEPARSTAWDVAYDNRFNRFVAVHVGVLDRHGSRELIVDPVKYDDRAAVVLASSGRSRHLQEEVNLQLTHGSGVEFNTSYVHSSAREDLNALVDFFDVVLLPYSLVNEMLEFVGARNQERFPTYVRLDAGFDRRLAFGRIHPWLGLRVANASNSFLPADVQANISSPAFGSFYNSVYREYRIHVLFGK